MSNDTWTEIQTLEAPLDHVVIGPTAKGDFQINDNPVQLRALGRALAAFVGIEPAEAMVRTDPYQDSFVKTLFYEFETDKDVRRVYTYPIVANPGAPFARLFTETGMIWSRNHSVPKEWADGIEHQVYITHVREGDRVRMARQSYIRAFHQFHGKQMHLGITPDAPNYVHPLDRMDKNVFVAMLSRGKKIGIRTTGLKRGEVIGILNQFYQDEFAELAGIPWEQRQQQ